MRAHACTFMRCMYAYAGMHMWRGGAIDTESHQILHALWFAQTWPNHQVRMRAMAPGQSCSTRLTVVRMTPLYSLGRANPLISKSRTMAAAHSAPPTPLMRYSCMADTHVRCMRMAGTGSLLARLAHRATPTPMQLAQQQRGQPRLVHACPSLVARPGRRYNCI